MNLDFFHITKFFADTRIHLLLKNSSYNLYNHLGILVAQYQAPGAGESNSHKKKFSFHLSDQTTVGHLEIDPKVGELIVPVLSENFRTLSLSEHFSFHASHFVNLNKKLLNLLFSSENLSGPIEVYEEGLSTLLQELRIFYSSKELYFFTLQEQNEQSSLVLHSYFIDQKYFTQKADLTISSDIQVLSQIVLGQKKSYQSPDPSSDANFSFLYELEKTSAPKNLEGVALLFGQELLGILCFKNLAHAFEEGPRDHTLGPITKYLEHLLMERRTFNYLLKAEAVNSHLEKYLSKNVVENIKQKGLEKIGGVEKHVVVLFALIRDFEEYSSKIPAKKLVQFLNIYFDNMQAIVSEFNGTLDKIICPAFMVVWNHPEEIPNPEALSIKASIKMQHLIETKISPLFAAHGMNNFNIGIGINCGLAIAGNLGCKNFMDYTVIGDTINTAQGLESKAGPGEILVHSRLRDTIKDTLPYIPEKRGGIKVKGKKIPITAYVYTAKNYS